MYTKTQAFKKIARLNKRIRIVQGGTSASKTVSILLYLIALAQSDKTPTLTSIVSESFPHLKRGAVRDFLMILKEHHYYREARWNKTESFYEFETGSKIEFFSADQPEKMRGARRDRLFLNEVNNVSFEAFEQLEVRTKEFIYLDYNPTSEFWLADVELKRQDTEKIILTYKDNEALSKEIIDSIETRKNRPGWWQVYGLGLVGEVEGRIFTGWQIIDSVPHEARLERFGIDFGYTNDPTSIVAIFYYNGGYIWDEILFQKGLSNRQIAETILNQPRKALSIADSAEPKSIDEIRSYGVNIQAAVKGQGSVSQRIQMTQDQAISVTKQSLNIIKEYRNYMWLRDKDGRILNEPDHLWSHSMDAGMYGMGSLVPMIQRREMSNMRPKPLERERVNKGR